MLLTGFWVPEAGNFVDLLKSYWAVILLSLVACILVRYVQQVMYWRKKGIPGPVPMPIIGTHYLFLGEKAYVADTKLWKEYGPLVGLIDSGTPVIQVSDPEITQQLIVTNFSSLADSVPPFYDDIGRHALSGSNGEEWKMLHRVIFPLFSNARLQPLVPQIIDCLKRMEKQMDKRISQSSDVDGEDISLKYMADLSTRSIFSLDHDIYQDPESDFVQEIFNVGQYAWWRFLLITILPSWFLVAINFGVFLPTSKSFLVRAIRHVLHQKRQQEPAPQAVRDLTQMIMAAGQKNPDLELTDKQMIGNMLLLMIASLHGPASVMQLMMRHLAQDPELQERVRKDVLSRPPLGHDVHMHDDRSSLVDCCVNETARLYPATNRLDRVCRKDCVVHLPDGKDLVIEEGVVVRINVYALGRDPDVYPNPNSFDPERFMPGGVNHETRIPTFGIGPRNCAGEKFARLSLRLALDYLLRRYRFSIQDTTPALDLSYASAGFIAHKVYVNVQRLN